MTQIYADAEKRDDPSAKQINSLFLLLTAFLPLTSCTAFNPANSMAKPKQTVQHFETTTSKKVGANYLLFLPEGYRGKPAPRSPLILFLHGIGERGNDPWKVKVHGPPKVAERMSNFPFIVVSPQCPNGQWWSNEILAALLDDVIARYNVDTNRIYLTGLSMGGFGAWSLALEFPERFAAVAPLCGWGQSVLSGQLRRSPPGCAQVASILGLSWRPGSICGPGGIRAHGQRAEKARVPCEVHGVGGA